ncbi:MAG: TorF family putative porin, partial [Rhodocyclaceae bacterium]
VFAGAACLSLPAGWAAAAEPVSPHTVTANVSLTDNYLFRGLTPTWGEAYASASNRTYYDRMALFANSSNKNLGGGHWLISAGRTF